jgi:2,3,4,5-tetrahydropyridine-2-carboxylate N-succinyltransferase/tetrahydrodipicolinate N-acetyltransferase
VRVQLRSGGTIRLGARVQVRDAVFVKSDGDLDAGDDVVLGHGTNVACTERVAIGARAGLGERVSVTDSDHAADGSDRWYLDQPLRTAPVAIGNNVLVSAGVTILRGAEIGPNAVVAAGAVVPAGDWPGAALLGGVPARVLKRLG